MKRYQGGDRAQGGTYFNRDRWNIVAIDKKHGTLPGGREERYIRLPMVVLATLGPLMGALYVIALPVFGIGMTLALGTKKVFSLLMDAIAPLGDEREDSAE